MKRLFINIKQLVQVREQPLSFVAGENMQKLPVIEQGFLLVENGKIVDFGKMKNVPTSKAMQVIDATGKLILPAWCDSHTHLVFAKNRETEFVDRIKGLTYEEIANKGGGILNSAKATEEISEEELFLNSKQRLQKLMSLGTGAIEIKSGYGLTISTELKMLKVIRRLQEFAPIPIKSTFLGAHAFPDKNNKEAYIDELITKMIPAVNKAGLADYIDVFCEQDYFSLEETDRILEAGRKWGLIPKIHTNQFNVFGGVGMGVKHKALSVDHLEMLTENDIDALKNSDTMPVALPNCSFFLGIPYTPARRIIDAGLPLALASDFNPGSAPSGNMNFVVASACINMKMTPEESINAATLNGAYAMGLEKKVGSITKNKYANIILTKPINSYNLLPYFFAENLIEKVYFKGEEWIS